MHYILGKYQIFWFSPDFDQLVLHDYATDFKKIGIVFQALDEICRFRGVLGSKTKCKVSNWAAEYPNFRILT